MVLRKLPVESHIIVQSAGIEMVICHTVFQNITILARIHLRIIIINTYLIPFPIIDRAEQIKIPEAVAKVQRRARVADPILQVLVVGCIQVESESLAITPDGPDAYDR